MTPTSPQTIAYLTSVYPRASDSFIRGEIRALRQLGWTVHTHAVRRPAPDQLVSDDIRHEHAATSYLLSAGPIGALWTLLTGLAALFLHRPARVLRANRLAWHCRWPGLKGHLWPVAYLAQAALLSRRLQQQKVTHLHNHIGENSAAVALLAATLAGIPYSLTIHGPYEFDAPARLALRTKIHHAKFIAAISDFTRAQLCRWARPEDWSKIQVVHCAVAPDFLDLSACPGAMPCGAGAPLGMRFHRALLYAH
ncbi:MAG: glycosyltransferase, partial [Phycisphaerae bacterium]